MPHNPHADFTPTLKGYSGQEPFRFWCQLALPLTYDDSLSYYELLNKVVTYLNHTIEDVSNMESNVGDLHNAYVQLQNYVNEYFDNIDIEAELRNVLDKMALDGSLDVLLDPLVANHLPEVVEAQIDSVVGEQIGDTVADQIGAVVDEKLPPLVTEGIPGEVSDWLEENVDPVGSAVMVDSSLTISGAAADAKVTGDELSELKTQLSFIEKSVKYSYIDGKFIDVNGRLATNEQYAYSDFVPCDSSTEIYLIDIHAGSSVLAYAFYSEKDENSFISGQNNLSGDIYNITIPSNANYIRFSSRTTDGISTTWNPEAYVYNLHKTSADTETLKNDFADLSNDMTNAKNDIDTIQNKLSSIEPIDTTFFDIYDYISLSFVEFVSGMVGTNGKFQIRDNFSLTSIKLKIDPNTNYILQIPGADRNTGTSNETGIFEGDTAYDTLTVTRDGDYISFYTGADVNYAIIYFYAGTYDMTHGYENIHLFKNSIKTDLNPTVKRENLPIDYISSYYPYKLNILVFGDSISDTANITIDSETKKTTAYSIKNPNNSYIKDGVTINYAMWPTLIQRVLNVTELRNYAKSGAHFYTTTNPPADPRQKLLYQVEVALNDLSNSNHVFEIDDFNPDIVIVACGINDGNIAAGSFETTMAKTVMKSGDVGVDVEATMEALNQQNPEDAARYVFMLLKQTFPSALLLYVNPLQQTYGTNETRLIAREELRKIAEQYDFINLDGFAQFGVVRDFETQNEVGLLTKDGLHPNDKGQNLYARNIVQAIKRYYFPLDSFNP